MVGEPRGEPTLSGEDLPRLRTSPPGPASVALARRLANVESRNVTCMDPAPIFWAEARGANVRDADGNVYVDLTAGFGVAAAGHANPRVVAAIAAQAGALPHALGDVHPAAIKARLLERLAALAPGDLSVSILGSSGAEAVEAALKTALLHTGRPGILAFEGAYHGLTMGALAATWSDHFRAPFRDQLFAGVSFAPYAAAPEAVAGALDAAGRMLDAAERGRHPIGAVLVEPVQGRGGIVVPPPAFLEGLRAMCDGRTRVLIVDEIYTGFGRTGRWFACEHHGITPDLLAAGKALSGSVPISAAIGTPAIMKSWPASTGEAVHTSTFLGNPIACAAALAQIEEIESRGLLDRAERIGATIADRARDWAARFTGVSGVRGLGALQAVVLRGRLALDACAAALRRGVLVLAEGPRLDVLAITPPLVITDAQLEVALDAVEAALAEVDR